VLNTETLVMICRAEYRHSVDVSSACSSIIVAIYISDYTGVYNVQWLPTRRVIDKVWPYVCYAATKADTLHKSINNLFKLALFLPIIGTLNTPVAS